MTKKNYLIFWINQNFWIFGLNFHSFCVIHWILDNVDWGLFSDNDKDNSNKNDNTNDNNDDNNNNLINLCFFFGGGGSFEKK